MRLATTSLKVEREQLQEELDLLKVAAQTLLAGAEPPVRHQRAAVDGDAAMEGASEQRTDDSRRLRLLLRELSREQRHKATLHDELQRVTDERRGLEASLDRLVKDASDRAAVCQSTAMLRHQIQEINKDVIDIRLDALTYERLVNRARVRLDRAPTLQKQERAKLKEVQEELVKWAERATVADASRQAAIRDLETATRNYERSQTEREIQAEARRLMLKDLGSASAGSDAAPTNVVNDLKKRISKDRSHSGAWTGRATSVRTPGRKHVPAAKDVSQRRDSTAADPLAKTGRAGLQSEFDRLRRLTGLRTVDAIIQKWELNSDAYHELQKRIAQIRSKNTLLVAKKGTLQEEHRTISVSGDDGSRTEAERTISRLEPLLHKETERARKLHEGLRRVIKHVFAPAYATLIAITRACTKAGLAPIALATTVSHGLVRGRKSSQLSGGPGALLLTDVVEVPTSTTQHLELSKFLEDILRTMGQVDDASLEIVRNAPRGLAAALALTSDEGDTHQADGDARRGAGRGGRQRKAATGTSHELRVAQEVVSTAMPLIAATLHESRPFNDRSTAERDLAGAQDGGTAAQPPDSTRQSMWRSVRVGVEVAAALEDSHRLEEQPLTRRQVHRRAAEILGS